DVLDRGTGGDLDLQRLASGGNRLGELGGRGSLGGSLVDLFALGGSRSVGSRGRTLAADRQGHVERVLLGAEVGGDDAHRAGGFQVVGIERALDPLLVVLDRLPDRLVAAVDVAGVDHQQVLGRHLDHGQVAQRDVVGAVVEVRHGGQHVGHAAQAQLHVVADVAADVQAGVTADQVPTVFDVIGLGDLDVAVVLAGGLQQELGGLVVTLGRVVDLDDDLLVGDAFDDLPAARTDAVVTGNVIKTRTDASLGTGRTQLDLRIAQNQRVPVPEAAQVVHRVVHDGHPAVGFHALRDMAMVGKYDTDQQGQAGHDPQGDQELDKTGHS